MDKIKKFLASYNITTHSIVAFCGVMVLAFHNVPQFHDLVLAVWQHVPKGAKEAGEAIVAVVAWYWKGRKEWTPEQRQKLEGGNNANQTNSTAASAGSGSTS